MRRMLAGGATLLWTCAVLGQSAEPVGGPTSPTARAVPMRELSLRAAFAVDDRDIRAIVSTGIATPLGVIPLRSTVAVHVDCRGEFEGTIAFHPLVRFLARLKGIALATNVSGRLLPACESTCLVLNSDSVTARVRVERLHVSGAIYSAGDSALVRGSAWMNADTAYHGQLQLTHRSGSRELFITVFERGRARRPESP